MDIVSFFINRRLTAKENMQDVNYSSTLMNIKIVDVHKKFLEEILLTYRKELFPNIHIDMFLEKIL